jgi:hypothetical protein
MLFTVVFPLFATAPAQQRSGKVSSTLPAQRASGPLTFINQTNVDVIIQTTILIGKSGISVTFTGPITVHPVNPTYVTVTGYAVNGGPAGNIPAFDIDQYCCAPNKAIIVKNGAFTGGRLAVQGTANTRHLAQATQDLGAASQFIGDITTTIIRGKNGQERPRALSLWAAFSVTRRNPPAHFVARKSRAAANHLQLIVQIPS